MSEWRARKARRWEVGGGRWEVGGGRWEVGGGDDSLTLSLLSRVSSV